MSDLILSYTPLTAGPWHTFDPFLFCVHHNDAYPAGDVNMAPKASLAGRHIGSDFSRKEGWSMYHGETVPGFPQHPHRGFETITIAKRGYIDHSDSLGATARFGSGDVQWMTAGSGIVHAEMFPLISEKENPTELFQIWLNLPKVDKMTSPYFTMFWSEKIPSVLLRDEAGRVSTLTVIAGAYQQTTQPLSPPPNSWAARPDSHVVIWTVSLPPKAMVTLPPVSPKSSCGLYFFKGSELWVGAGRGGHVEVDHMVMINSGSPIEIQNGDQPAEVLILQGRPIGEPVVQYGPFVMNSSREIRRAIQDYQETSFGGWPWPRRDPVHKRSAGRFAIHADGHREQLD